MNGVAPAAVRRKRQRKESIWVAVDWVRFALSVVIVLTLGHVALLLAASSAHAATRLKDVVNVEGVRDNMLIGYGLVVGLNGTGDKLQNTAFTEQSLSAFLERLGVNTRDANLKTRNVAAVTVTATLPPFARQGSRIDISVNALGDAKSLQGGTLLATPLYAADGQVYAVGQGALAVGGFSAGGDAAVVTKGVPTSAAIANGAIVEREIDFDLNALPSLNLALRNPDVTTATRIAATINNRMGAETATLVDPSTVRLNVPNQYRNNVTLMLAQVEQLPIETDQIARVVIDEASGTIVMGENVRIDTVAVAQGSLVVRVEETPQVSQPGAFAPEGAQTVVVPRTNVQVEEGASQMLVMNSGATLNELVAGLNSLGVTPRDLITILQTIKAAGALQAEIETR
ncbi:MAG: flagellar basal body P-ring protein FlgI [Alphaproteobacteria bacterium]|nr:flagellar basal body P-ring protein FlgI [Alphaproteobacteria bacterium]